MALASWCARDAHGHGKVRRMIGPARRDQLVGGQRQSAPLRPFLQRRFRVARRHCHLGSQRCPEPLDEGLRRRQPAIEIDRRDHRLHNIGEDPGIARGAGGRLGRRQPQMAIEPDPGGDPRQRVAAHQMGKPPRQRPLLLMPEAAPQEIGDDQAKHPVAEEFEPFIAAGISAGRRPPRAPPSWPARRRQRARMGQRLGEELGPGELVPDRALPEPCWPMPSSSSESAAQCTP